MPLDTGVCLNIAGDLLKNGNYEEAFRSSANRSYYSVFHECCRIAKNYSYMPNNKKHQNFGHTELHKLLIQHKDINLLKQRNINKIGRILKQCKNLRAKADYKDNLNFSYNQANDSLVNAGRIMQLAQQV